MEINVKHVEGLSFLAKGDTNHWVTMDTAKSVGGSEGASKPLELVLMALGGCTGMDVVSILKKMRVPFQGLEVRVKADQAEDYPKVFTAIALDYRIRGNQVDRDKVEKAVAMSRDKYCSVSAMLRKAVPITDSITILPEDSERRDDPC